MKKYLYLAKPEFASTWVNGGEIPIYPASRYRSMERSGVFTPDENLIHDSPVDLFSLSPIVSFGPNPNVRNFTFTGNTLNGRPLPNFTNASLYTEDGIILSFANEFDLEIARRLEKKACVEIKSIERLKTLLDRRLGKTSKARDCEYTNDHQRNHFLKSTEDAWQKEYRFFWRITEERKVILPAGLARVVWVDGE
ncbi:MAG: hypothetical protein JKY26_06785 [Pseudomonas sp.]|nr:hypothetical protein [Pseudomonas sp.]